MPSVGANQDGKHNKSFPSSEKVPSKRPHREYENAGPQVLSNVLMVLRLLLFYLHYFNKLQSKITCIVLLRQITPVCKVKGVVYDTGESLLIFELISQTYTPLPSVLLQTGARLSTRATLFVSHSQSQGSV